MKFIRRDSGRYSKIGKNRKKLQKWRKPKGRDNKMRERRFGYPKSPSVGYKSKKTEAGRVSGKVPFRACNVGDLSKTGKDSLIIIGSVGAKKKLEIIKKASEMGLSIVNVNQSVGGKNNATK